METNKGKYMEAKLYTKGHTLCQMVKCIIYLTFFKDFSCMPSYISYSIITMGGDLLKILGGLTSYKNKFPRLGSFSA